jgi:stage II sporulation protein D
VKRARAIAVALAVGFSVHSSGFSVPPGSGQNPAPGTLRVGFLRPAGGYTVLTLPLEPYVARVLSGEAARGSRPAALEALAITIRTFALANRGRHRADGFDVCDQTHCQVVRAADAATERAAQTTSGRVLLRDGAPASVFYTASCGGRTEKPSNVWPGAEDPSFLPSQDDDACRGAPAWTAEIHARDLLRALRAAGFRGSRLRDARIAERNGSGRVARLTLDGLRPDQISGQDLRVAVGRALGWQHIKSTAFNVRRRGDAYVFQGHGFGHGVGMCVIGAARLAERGANAGAILARYFPGLPISDAGLTESRPSSDPIARSAEPRPSAPATAAGVSPRSDARLSRGADAVTGVSLSLPDEDEGQRDVILRQTRRARDELARALGVAAPTDVTLRFHPTTDDYERVTGQRWFTSATVMRKEVHLLPLAVLRDRGVLERTIRHELVHVMTDAVLAKRPMWVREGAAIYFAGEQPIPGEPTERPPFKPKPRSSCPDDAELRQPVSVGALSNAYARARACFALQTQSGKMWRDVR